jgi:hypothetical protein
MWLQMRVRGWAALVALAAGPLQQQPPLPPDQTPQGRLLLWEQRVQPHSDGSALVPLLILVMKRATDAGPITRRPFLASGRTCRLRGRTGQQEPPPLHRVPPPPPLSHQARAHSRRHSSCFRPEPGGPCLHPSQTPLPLGHPRPGCSRGSSPQRPQQQQLQPIRLEVTAPMKGLKAEGAAAALTRGAGVTKQLVEAGTQHL